MTVVDQFNDPAFGTLFHQVTRMPALEAFVKEASIEPVEAGTLPNSAFAWPDERRFPIHTREHTAMSYAYSKLASKLPKEVTENIKVAMDVFGVPESIFAETKIAAAEPTEADYLIPDLKLFVVKTAEDVKAAQQQLVSGFERLDLEHRAVACGNLVKKADEFKVELHPLMLKLSGLVVSDLQQTRRWVEARSSAVKDDFLKQAYQTLADGLKNRGAEAKDRPALLKLASVIAELDHKAGLDRHYDRRLPDALQTVFNTEKLAAQCVDLGGSMVPIAKLAAMPASFWGDLGGNELESEVAPGGIVDAQKLATVLETLPLDLKLVLRSQMRA